MYKLLLCWRYLLTRYLALACIISVMLGVATLIVVNSVMSGFSTKLKDRLHGLLSDVLVESQSINGFADPEGKMRLIQESAAGPRIEAMTPTLEIFAMIQFGYRGDLRPVHLIGIDPEGRARVGGFAEHLVLQRGSPCPTFQLGEAARRRQEEIERQRALLPGPQPLPTDMLADADGLPPPLPPPAVVKHPEGIIIGHAIAHFRYKDPQDENRVVEVAAIEPGDDVVVTTVSGQKLAPVSDRFAVCDYFRSEMSEYDSNYVFVPLRYLQENMRCTPDQVTSIQIKLKDYRQAGEVVKVLRQLFPERAGFRVETWEDKQGPLLAAIRVERGLLNVLLFLIVCVAGFGILAIFTMIVVEKTRDIGILKALGASNGGILKIFLTYGLLLGVVGALLGTALGLTLTIRINDIEKFLAGLTGQDIFPRDVYYFDRIPTDIQPWTVAAVNAGAILVAVLFSIIPALRAAMLHPSARCVTSNFRRRARRGDAEVNHAL